MGQLVAVDGSVLLGLTDPDNRHHASAVAAVRELRDAKTRFIAPATAVGDVLLGAARQGERRLRTTLEQTSSVFRIQDIDLNTAMTAARLQAKHTSLLRPDALAIAAGQVARATEILTVHKQWEDADPRVRVIG